jgi:acyl-coenzyme A thioesterase PaaI-like protein
MLLDEIMVWGVMHYAGKTSFTGKMDVRFVEAVETGVPLLLEARPVKLSRRLAKMRGRLLEAGSGRLLCDGGGTYVIPSPKEFRENFGVQNVPEEFASYLRS